MMGLTRSNTLRNWLRKYRQPGVHKFRRNEHSAPAKNHLLASNKPMHQAKGHSVLNVLGICIKRSSQIKV